MSYSGKITRKYNRRSIYVPEDLLQQMQAEAKRQERSLSWILQQAWKIARNDLAKLPSMADLIHKQP